MRGYENQPTSLNTTLTFSLSDIGVIHPDNTLEVKGRKSDCLRFKINQKVVYPSYVEQAVERFPGVSECAVSF